MMDVIQSFLLNYIATVATFVLVVAYMPQLIRTYKTKDVSGISTVFWVLMTLALFLLLVNSITVFIAHGTWGYMLTEAFNFVLSLAMLVMTIAYKK